MNPLERRLWATAEYRGATYGFSPACEGMLRAFILTGANILASQNVQLGTVQMAMAEANLVRFLDAMIIEAQRVGLTELHENTFLSAQASLCPLWPFC